MESNEVGKYWNENAPAWIKLASKGYDTYRDWLNTPAFMALLPDIRGLRGLDIGCGEGHNTRQMAKNGAYLTGIDIADRFIEHARSSEEKEPLGISYEVGSAMSLPFKDHEFDFATAIMCLMDMPKPETVLSEVVRVIKPGGFFQFSITHPCFDTPHRRNLRDKNGMTYAIETGGYFEFLNGQIDEWIFGSAPEELKKTLPKFKVPRFNYTISQWLNMLIKTGFVIEQVEEPKPSDEVVDKCPEMQDAQVVPYFFHVRARKL
jgi:SAM-dependent methyltransferase